MRMATQVALWFALVLSNAWCEDGASGSAQDAPAVQEMSTAFASDDRDAKVQAVRDLLASELSDEAVIPLLVGAVGDYQAHAEVVQALRARTGLTPPVYEHQSHYPAYPWSDDPLAWQSWLTQWRRDHAAEASIDEALREARAAQDAGRHALQDAEHAQAQRSVTDTASSAQP
jgi:hypothetical protein